MIVPNQVEVTEEVNLEDVAAEAVASVNADDAGAEKGTVTAPVEKVPNVVETEDKEISDKTEEEEASLDDIMAEKPKTDVEKAKEGTPEWLQKRIDKQTRQNKEALEAKDKEIQELKAKIIPDKRPPVPVPDDYLSKEEYQEAYQVWKDQDDEWKASNRDKVAREKVAQEKLNKSIENFKKGAERMSARYSDFNKVVNEDTYYGHLDNIILSTEFPGEIGYHLGKNPAKLEALLNMDMVSAIIAIGEMSAKCKASKTNSLTTAPTVLKTGKDSRGGVDEDNAGFSTAEIDKMSKSFLNTA